LVLRCANSKDALIVKNEKGVGSIHPFQLLSKMAKTRVFVAKHCGPCHIVKDMVEKGKASEQEIELIDIESDEGFPYIAEFALSGVPSAYKDKQKCEIKIDQEADILYIICPDNPKEAPPSSDEGQESPH